MLFRFLTEIRLRTPIKSLQKTSSRPKTCKFRFLKNRRSWPPDNVFWWKNNVLQISSRNTLENAYKITSKSKFSTQNVQIPYHLHPALSYSLHSWCQMAVTDFLKASLCILMNQLKLWDVASVYESSSVVSRSHCYILMRSMQYESLVASCPW